MKCLKTLQIEDFLELLHLDIWWVANFLSSGVYVPLPITLSLEVLASFPGRAYSVRPFVLVGCV